MHEREDVGLSTLLELDGEIYDQGDGYWVKIEARRVVPTLHVPHGIRYSLTLHDRYGMRMLGFDNAHAIPCKGRRHVARRLDYDHRHRHSRDRGVPYIFVSAHRLLADFFHAVDATLESLKS
jgi:hypothetical protein